MTEKHRIRELSETSCLLVQSCHLPQFFFIAERMARQFGGPVDALFIDHPDARIYLGFFSCFRNVYFFKDAIPEEVRSYENLFFPLLNRGYPRIKRVLLSSRARIWEADYDARLRPLSRARLIGSSVLALHEATPEFIHYLKTFPQKSLGKRILFLESCHPSLILQTRGLWQKAVPPSAEITRVPEFSYSKSWRSFRKKYFDAAIVFYSGERGFLGLKALPFLLRIREVLVVNENGNHFYASPRALVRFLFQRIRHGVALPERTPVILLFQTEGRDFVLEAARRLRQTPLHPDADIVLVCQAREEREFLQSAEIGRILTFDRRDLRRNFSTLREIWRLNPDIVSAVFAGRRGFTLYKLLFLLLADRRRLVFNAHLDCYWLSPRNLLRLLRRDELLLHKLAAQVQVLFVQTESWQYTEQAIQALVRPKLFPNARVTLLCRAADRGHFTRLPCVTKIFTFQKDNRRDLMRILRHLRQVSPDLVCALFTGRKGFWKQKLLVMLYLRRRRLIFNAGLDCYWLTFRTIPRLFRQEPLLFEPAPETVSEVLMIQTEADSETVRAMEVLLSGKVVPNKKVAVLCAAEKHEVFARLPVVERIYTYRPGTLRGNLKTARQLLRRDRDVVVALLTGRPIYRIQKLLFFLLPARHRLVFNENRDCFYFRRGRITQLLRLPSLAVSLQQRKERVSGARLVFRHLAKAVLFLPRFVYLLGWVTFAKLRRSYLLQD